MTHVTEFGSSTPLLHASEALFSGLWLAGLVVVWRTGPTAIRLGTYLGTTVYAFLWDWIQGQDWFFRTTFDDRLVPAFSLDGRQEPLFAPLAYGLVFGTLAVGGLALFPWLHRRIGAWTYVLAGLLGGVLDVLVEGGVAVSTLKMYVMGYDPGWTVLHLPWIVPLYVALLTAALLWAVVTLQDLVAERRETRDAAGLWLICLVLPAGVNYLVVAALTLVFDAIKPW